eukprot:s4774_g2.t1
MSDFKEGDWMCSQCGDHQFARNTTCRKCGNPRDGGARGGGGGRMPAVQPPTAHRGDFKEGDWICSECGDHQFARNETCRKCGAPRPATSDGLGGFGSLGGMAGLGGFPAIGQSQGFRASALAGVPGAASVPPQYIEQAAALLGVLPPRGSVASVLPVAQTASLSGGFKPGDWNCPSCGDHQFGRNETCRKCGTPKPADVSASRQIADRHYDRAERPAAGAPNVYGIAGSLLADIQARAAGGAQRNSSVLSSNNQAMKPGLQEVWRCKAKRSRTFPKPCSSLLEDTGLAYLSKKAASLGEAHLRD